MLPLKPLNTNQDGASSPSIWNVNEILICPLLFIVSRFSAVGRCEIWNMHENPSPTKQFYHHCVIADPWPFLVHRDLSFRPRDSPSARPAMTFPLHNLIIWILKLQDWHLFRRIWSSSLLQASYQVCALTQPHGITPPGHRPQGHAQFLADIKSKLYWNQLSHVESANVPGASVSGITLGFAKWHMGALHTTTISPWKAVAETFPMSECNNKMFGKWKRRKKSQSISEKRTNVKWKQYKQAEYTNKENIEHPQTEVSGILQNMSKPLSSCCAK